MTGIKTRTIVCKDLSEYFRICKQAVENGVYIEGHQDPKNKIYEVEIRAEEKGVI